MIAIIDYDIGNLQSVRKALERVGATAIITREPTTLDVAQGIILPGVGAFGNGMANLKAQGWIEPLLNQVRCNKPLLGICLGMQLLFAESEEMGQHAGLGLLQGRVVRFPEGEFRVPHIGWNQLRLRRAHDTATQLLEGIPDGAYVYFVHSYYGVPGDPEDILATTEYGVEFASVVGRGSVFGVQFHPEKSQEIGLRLLQNFVSITDRATSAR
ncbi:MAG: imidazole glycerol phosphate synthase subunit HisH [Anaerolineae bacterium]